MSRVPTETETTRSTGYGRSSWLERFKVDGSPAKHDCQEFQSMRLAVSISLPVSLATIFKVAPYAWTLILRGHLCSRVFGFPLGYGAPVHPLLIII